MSSFRSRRLRENRQYHRTQVTIMTGSNWRFRNRGGRQDLMLSTYQISRCNTSLRHIGNKIQASAALVFLHVTPSVTSNGKMLGERALANSQRGAALAGL